MSNPQPPPLPPRPQMHSASSEQGASRADFIASLQELRNVFDRLALRIKRQTFWQIIAGGVFVLVSGLLLGHSCHTAGRLSDVTAQLADTARLLEDLRGKADKTEASVQGVKETVEQVRDEQPSIDFVKPDGGRGRPSAAIVVRPKTPRPATAASAGAPPPPPAISIPIALPPGSKTIVEDAGAK